MKTKKEKIINRSLNFLFILSFIPIPSILILVKNHSEPFISVWSLVTIAWLILNTEIDIAWTLQKQKSEFWEDLVALWDLISWIVYSKLPWLKNISKIENSKFHKKIIALGYLGMFLCTLTPNLGRFGDISYASAKHRFPYGRLFLYAIIRI